MSHNDLGFLRALAGVADAITSRARIANTAGLTYSGARDLYETCGYKRQLFATDYRSRYRRNAVAARIVECKPVDTWRGGFEVYDDDASNVTTTFEKEWTALDKRLGISTVLQRADILAGIGRYAIVLITAPGDMSTPLTVADAAEIKQLDAYAEDDAPIKEYEIDKSNARFGQPVFYEIRRTNPQGRGGAGMLATKVHWTRVIHIADSLLDDRVFGIPRLERVWNLLDDLEKVTGGGSEAFWMRANQGMHINIDPALNPTQPELDEMAESVDNYRHRLERVIRTRGADIDTLSSDTADFKGPASAIQEQIAAGIGVPMRVLMGTEQGKLASGQDSVKYYRDIETRRINFAEKQVVVPFVDRLIGLTALPQPKEGLFKVGWSQLKTRDDDEKADMAAKWAQVNATNGNPVVTENEIREHCLGLGPLKDVVSEEVGSKIIPPAPAAPAEGSGAVKPRAASEHQVVQFPRVRRVINRDRRGLISEIVEEAAS